MEDVQLTRKLGQGLITFGISVMAASLLMVLLVQREDPIGAQEDVQNVFLSTGRILK